jgi:hypothetical protein
MSKYTVRSSSTFLFTVSKACSKANGGRNSVTQEWILRHLVDTILATSDTEKMFFFLSAGAASLLLFYLEF